MALTDLHSGGVVARITTSFELSLLKSGMRMQFLRAGCSDFQGVDRKQGSQWGAAAQARVPELYSGATAHLFQLPPSMPRIEAGFGTGVSSYLYHLVMSLPLCLIHSAKSGSYICVADEILQPLHCYQQCVMRLKPLAVP